MEQYEWRMRQRLTYSIIIHLCELTASAAHAPLCQHSIVPMRPFKRKILNRMCFLFDGRPIGWHACWTLGGQVIRSEYPCHVAHVDREAHGTVSVATSHWAREGWRRDCGSVGNGPVNFADR